MAEEVAKKRSLLKLLSLSLSLSLSVSVSQVAKKSVLPKVLAELRTTADRKASWQGKIIMTSAGPVTSPTMPDSPIG